jgi:hypothetical protein
MAKSERSWLEEEEIKRAKDHQTTANELAKLANSEYVVTRRFVACHSNTPPEILKQLSTDSDISVRHNIASNSHTPHETLNRLAGDSEVSMRMDIAKNRNTPPDALKQLAGDSEISVRMEIAKNDSASAESLIDVCPKELVSDDDFAMAKALLWNSNIPQKVINIIVQALLHQYSCIGIETDSDKLTWIKLNKLVQLIDAMPGNLTKGYPMLLAEWDAMVFLQQLAEILGVDLPATFISRIENENRRRIPLNSAWRIQTATRSQVSDQETHIGILKGIIYHFKHSFTCKILSTFSYFPTPAFNRVEGEFTAILCLISGITPLLGDHLIFRSEKIRILGCISTSHLCQIISCYSRLSNKSFLFKLCVDNILAFLNENEALALRKPVEQGYRLIIVHGDFQFSANQVLRGHCNWTKVEWNEECCVRYFESKKEENEDKTLASAEEILGMLSPRIEDLPEWVQQKYRSFRDRMPIVLLKDIQQEFYQLSQQRKEYGVDSTSFRASSMHEVVAVALREHKDEPDWKSESFSGIPSWKSKSSSGVPCLSLTLYSGGSDWKIEDRKMLFRIGEDSYINVCRIKQTCSGCAAQSCD